MSGMNLYRVVIIILHDVNGKILLQQRTDDAAYMPGKWAYFGGGIEEGESPREAVLRETMEELNYEVSFPMMMLEQAFDIDGRPAYMYVFLEALEGEKESLELREGKNWGWFGPSDIHDLGMLERDVIIAETAFEYIALLEKEKSL